MFHRLNGRLLNLFGTCKTQSKYHLMAWTIHERFSTLLEKWIFQQFSDRKLETSNTHFQVVTVYLVLLIRIQRCICAIWILNILWKLFLDSIPKTNNTFSKLVLRFLVECSICLAFENRVLDCLKQFATNSNPERFIEVEVNFWFSVSDNAFENQSISMEWN